MKQSLPAGEGTGVRAAAGGRTVSRPAIWVYSVGLSLAGVALLAFLARDAVEQEAWRDPAIVAQLVSAFVVVLLAEPIFDPLATCRPVSYVSSATQLVVLLFLPPWIAAWSIGLAAGVAGLFLGRLSFGRVFTRFARQGGVAGIAGLTYWQFASGAPLSWLSAPAALAAGLSYWGLSSLLTLAGRLTPASEHSRAETLDMLWQQAQLAALSLLLALFYSTAQPPLFLLIPLVIIAQPFTAALRQNAFLLQVMHAANTSGSTAERARAVGEAIVRFTGADYFSFVAAPGEGTPGWVRLVAVGNGQLAGAAELSLAQRALAEGRELVWMDRSAEPAQPGLPQRGALLAMPVQSEGGGAGAAVLCFDEPLLGRMRQMLLHLRVAAGQLGGRRTASTQLPALGQEMEHFKSQFVANLSHELRTPLTTLAGYAEMLASWEFPPQRVQEMAQAMRDDTAQLGSMIDHLLDLSRIEAGQMSPDRETLALGNLVEEVVQSYAAPQKRRVSCVVMRPVPDVQADREQVERVLCNLIDNALQYSPEDSPVKVTVERYGDGARVAVHDAGIGVAPEHQESIFGRFTRVDNPQTAAVRGVGLGLAICKYIVEAHGGQIWTVSEAGRGSTFFFTLPAAPSGSAEGLRSL